MNSDRQVSREEFRSLTGIRFPLAAWVVAYHMSGSGHLWSVLRQGEWTGTFVSQANAALGTFFMLSGFLLAHRYFAAQWTKKEVRAFFATRVARIAPLYYLSVLLVAPIMWEQLSNPSSSANAGGMESVLSYLFVLQGWTRLPASWNTPAWSLSCELFFYSWFPLAGMLLLRRSWRSACLLVAAGFGLPIVLHAVHWPVECKPVFYAGDFLTGLACGVLYKLSRERLWLKGRGYILYGPGMIVQMAVLLWHDSFPWLLGDELMRAGNAAIILGLSFGGGVPERALSSRMTVLGGTASYAIYILHVPILWWFERTYFYQAMPRGVAGAIYLGVVCTIGVAASMFIEQPVYDRVRRALSHRSRFPQSSEVAKHCARAPVDQREESLVS